MQAQLNALQQKVDGELAELREKVQTQSNFLDHVIADTNRTRDVVVEMAKATIRHEQLLFPENDPKLQPLTHKLMKREDDLN